MNSTPLIEIQNVTKWYAQGDIAVHALQEVSFSIAAGEFAAVVGPSGSGKTTLLNMIGGLDIPSDGIVILDGKPVGKMRQKALSDFRRDSIGFIFQTFNLIPVLTVAENIEYVMVLQKVPKEERRHRVKEILEEMGLGGMEGRYPKQLSGGQQQRVAIARAMVAQPKIILADEPTANVDSHTGEALIGLMRSLNREKGMTFLFSTHDKRIMDHAHQIIRLQDGRVSSDIIQEGR